MKRKKRPTPEQISEFKNLYRQLRSLDNKSYCIYLLKSYGIKVATNYAKVVLNPSPAGGRNPSLHLTPYRGRV